MNGRTAKRIRKQSTSIAVEWLKSMLNDKEAAKVTASNIPNSNTHTYLNNTAYSMPYSLKGASRIIKMIIKRNSSAIIEEIDAAVISEYIKSTTRI